MPKWALEATVTSAYLFQRAMMKDPFDGPKGLDAKNIH